jgi:hypothetical protein
MKYELLVSKKKLPLPIGEGIGDSAEIDVASIDKELFRLREFGDPDRDVDVEVLILSASGPSESPKFS